MTKSLANLANCKTNIAQQITAGCLTVLIQVKGVNVCLSDLLLSIPGKQLRCCRDGLLINHTVPGQISPRQFISIKCPFFR